MSDRDISGILNRIENPEKLNVDPEELLARTDFERYPHRHPDQLQAAWEASETAAETARRLGSSAEAVSNWLHVYGYRETHTAVLADRLSMLDADEIGGSA